MVRLRRVFSSGSLRVLFAGVVLAVVLAHGDPGAALVELRRAPRWVFVVPVLLLLVNTGIQAVRMRLLLPAPRPPLTRLVRVALLGNFFGIFLPTGGGEAAKVLALVPFAGGLEEAAASLGVVRSLELLPWALLLVWGAIGVLPAHEPEYTWLAVGSAIVFFGAFGMVIATLFWGDPLLRRLPARFAARLSPLRRVGAARGRLVACLLLAFPFAFLNGAIVWAILLAYGHPIAYRMVLGLIPALDVVISLPITVSGVGVREGLFVHAFAAWGIPAPVALAIAFTRWTGEVGRALLGGVLFVTSGERSRSVTVRAERGGYPAEHG